MIFFRILLTESYSDYAILREYYGNSSDPGSDVPFNFAHLRIDKNYLVDRIEKGIKSWLEMVPDNKVPNWVVRL